MGVQDGQALFRVADRQQAIKSKLSPTSTHPPLSYWMELVSIDTLAQNLQGRKGGEKMWG